MKEIKEKLRTGRRAYSFLSVVIVLLVAGILITAVVFGFREVTAFKRLDEFRGTCREVAQSITLYKLINGFLPADRDELARYFVGGWSILNGRPKGAEYDYRDGVFTASYTDLHGESHKFVFPDLTDLPE